MANEGKIVVELTKKDKVYLSIIFVLICVCFVLAIVLPRPYKEVEVEKPVYEKVYQKVYETEQLNLVSGASSLYDEGIDGCLFGGISYKASFVKNYIDTGTLMSIRVSVKIEEAGKQIQKTITLNENLCEVIVSNSSLNSFGIKIEITNNVMDNINDTFKQMLGEKKNEPLDYYLFEVEFEKCVVNYIVTFIGAE